LGCPPAEGPESLFAAAGFDGACVQFLPGEVRGASRNLFNKCSAWQAAKVPDEQRNARRRSPARKPMRARSNRPKSHGKGRRRGNRSRAITRRISKSGRKPAHINGERTAVNKPVATTRARARSGSAPSSKQGSAGDRLDQAQQDIRRVHGGEKAGGEEGGQEVQGRAAREVMGKLFLALMALSIAVLIGLSVWVIAL
jgi:hypothetical protein